MADLTYENGGRFEAVARSVPDGVLVLDASGSVVFANDEVGRIFGYGPRELIGGPASRLFADPAEPGAAAVERLGGAAEAGPGLERFEVTGARKDGAEVPLHVTYGTYEQTGDRFVTAIVSDLSERRRTESQMRFQARLLDAVGEAVIATDPAGRILYWNAAATRLYGWRPEEVVGRQVEEVTPADLTRSLAVELMARLRAGESWSGEFMVQDRDGRSFPVQVTDSPVLDDDGTLVGIIGTSKEISQRKRTEESQRFLAEAGRVLSSSLDHQTTLSRVSRLAVPMLGDWCMVHLLDDPEGELPPAEGPVPVAHCAPPGREEDTPLLEEVLTGEGGVLASVLPASEPLRLERSHAVVGAAAATRLDAIGIRELLVVPLASRNLPLGVMTFGRDASRPPFDAEDLRLAAELALRAGAAIENARLYREAEQSDRAKTDFLAVVSHELRTPLNAITGYAELLTGGISGPLNEKQAGQIERIRVSARHLAQLIDEILTYARMEGGRDEVELAATDLSEIVREAVSVLRPAADSKGLPLNIEAPESGPEIRTDPGKLRQIVVNLVSNAVKYTDSGSVTVTVRPEEGGVELAVKDTGVGIPTQEQERIFEPFRQVQSPNTRTVGGTGLGLSVSRRLVHLLGGDIHVDSEPGAGSTFTVWLPTATSGRGR